MSKRSTISDRIDKKKLKQTTVQFGYLLGHATKQWKLISSTNLGSQIWLSEKKSSLKVRSLKVTAKYIYKKCITLNALSLHRCFWKLFLTSREYTREGCHLNTNLSVLSAALQLAILLPESAANCKEPFMTIGWH